MTTPTQIKGGKVRVLLDPAGSGSYAAPCGFNQRSITLTKGLEDLRGINCDEPDALNWIERDAVSLSMGISGEGVLAEESVETWLDEVDNPDPVAVKVEWEFPTKTITWTGNMHIATFSVVAQDTRKVTATMEMSSSGVMTRVVT